MNEDRLAWVEKKKRRKSLKKDIPVLVGALLIAIGGNIAMSYQENLKKHPEQKIDVKEIMQVISDKSAEFVNEASAITNEYAVLPIIQTTYTLYQSNAAIIQTAVEHTEKFFTEMSEQEPAQKGPIDSPVKQTLYFQPQKLEYDRM